MGLKPTTLASLRFESFVGTMSSGVPGLTIAALMYELPKSIPSTADAADAVPVNKIRRRGIIVAIEGSASRLRLERAVMLCC